CQPHDQPGQGRTDRHHGGDGGAALARVARRMPTDRHRDAKGQGSEVALYEVLWQTEDVTSMLPGIATEARPARAMRLRLRCDDRELLLDERHSSITIGRAEDNDVVVKG